MELGRLEHVEIRNVWLNEAQHFTPWLFSNLENLGDALGLKLEPEGSEVAVDRYSADILARSSMDGAKVLIENQLEASNHTHLGQIMTYLAGLGAKVVIWAATDATTIKAKGRAHDAFTQQVKRIAKVSQGKSKKAN